MPKYFNPGERSKMSRPGVYYADEKNIASIKVERNKTKLLVAD